MADHTDRERPQDQPQAWRARFQKANDLQELAAVQEEAEGSSLTIADRYQILSTLGQGGMGMVYKARDVVLDLVVAVKTILPQHVSNPQASRRFLHEARALARLNHPNILRLYNFGQDGGLYYLVMELGGRDLSRILKGQAGPLPLEQTLQVAVGVCRALEYAHRHGVIHRDLKPANILVGSPAGMDIVGPGALTAGEALVVKVMDLGLAKVRGATTLTNVQAKIGTPQYMSPEQVRGKEATERSDLYAVGVMLYEMVTGVRPFDSDDPQAILYQHLNVPPEPPTTFNPTLPSALQALMLRLLDKNPSQRPTSAREVLGVLEAVPAEEMRMVSGKAASEGTHVLEVLGGGAHVVREIPVSGYIWIGRGSAEFKPDVLIPDECTSASRQHAALDLRGNRPVLEDHSRLGTIVNGRRLEHGTTDLSDRDEIIFGLPQNGWRVRFRIREGYTEEPDPLELLTVSQDPRQVRIGQLVVEETLGRDAFHLLRFLAENRGRWYPTERLVDVLWPDPDKMPIAANQALARSKKRVNDLLRPYLRGQDAIVSAPFRGYRMKPGLNGF